MEVASQQSPKLTTGLSDVQELFLPHQQKVNPTVFCQLQDLTTQYARRKLKDVLVTLQSSGALSVTKSEQDAAAVVDYKEFRRLMTCYLDTSVPESFLHSLFGVFLIKDEPKNVKEIKNEMPVEDTAKHDTLSQGPSETPNCQIMTDGKDTGEQIEISAPEMLEPGSQITATKQDLTQGNNHVEPSKKNTFDRRLLNVEVPVGKRESLVEFVKRLQSFSVNYPQANDKNEFYPSASDFEDSSGVDPSNPEADNPAGLINLKQFVCCLSLLEGGKAEDKLEFVFRLYDTDKNSVLDAKELDAIVDQMTTVAEYLDFDVQELRPILKEMVKRVDINLDGRVSLSEWKSAGLTTVPLLALLGMTPQDTEEGQHSFRMKHFNRPSYCLVCSYLLKGIGKQGLSCIYCKFSVHQKCANDTKDILQGCISTYNSARANLAEALNRHYWVKGNSFRSKCSECSKTVHKMQRLCGFECRWCKRTYHESCFTSSVDKVTTCDFGEFKNLILRPSSIFATDNNNSGFQIKSVPGGSPLLVLVNQKSGGKQGTKIMRTFQHILNPRQVFDLSQGGPRPGLTFFKDQPDFRILCCGGDGTVGWVLEEIDRVGFEKRPPVCVLPLGTGNDLARCLGWGAGYDGKKNMSDILRSVEESVQVMMDRWKVEIRNSFGEQIQSSFKMNNYFSIGCDASIAQRFHEEREKHPEKFNSRTRNKLWYFEFGTLEALNSNCKNLQEDIEIECDGVPLVLDKGTTLESIAVLNISSIYGGRNLWGNLPSPKKIEKLTKLSGESSPSVKQNLALIEQDIGDGKLELVGIEDYTKFTKVQIGFEGGMRLKQFKSLLIRTSRKFPMQIDGEPWTQEPCTIIITHKNRAVMLASQPSTPSINSPVFFPTTPIPDIQVPS